jgi:hypothetical protein
MTMKTLGIVAHSAEGGALCFITACREGAAHLGPHMHPNIVLSAVPMGLSMPGWLSGDRAVVAKNLTRGVQQVADAGADFFVCPDNTAHIVLEEIAADLPAAWTAHRGRRLCRDRAQRLEKRRAARHALDDDGAGLCEGAGQARDDALDPGGAGTRGTQCRDFR